MLFNNVRSYYSFKKEQKCDKLCVTYLCDTNGTRKLFANSNTAVLGLRNPISNKVVAVCDRFVSEYIITNEKAPEITSISVGMINDASLPIAFFFEILPSDRRIEWISEVYSDKMRRFAEKQDDGSIFIGMAKRDYKILINPVFLEIGIFNWKYGLAPAQFYTGKWGYINYIGRTKIQPDFDFAQPFTNEGYAIICKNGDERRIDQYGNICHPESSSWEDDLFEAFEGNLELIRDFFEE